MNTWMEKFSGISDYVAIDWIAMTLLIISAFMAIRMRDLLASSVMLGVFSLLMALIYLLLDAPDVALTEAAVGAGISTVLFLGTLSFTEREHEIAPIKRRIVPLLVVILVGSALIIATADLPPFGAADSPMHQHTAPYYIENTRTDIDIPNMVTAVLASYRGFDTMGEVGVIFTAGISITALLMNLPQLRSTPASPPTQTPASIPQTPPVSEKSKRKTTTRRKKTRAEIKKTSSSASSPPSKAATKKKSSSPRIKKGGKS
ncbi:MAG: DUF4040 domain-containing protein [Alphaproteobacteria bacterium]|nr:DUF4040 domain-containing protein [Alphaproteobacteria bacterium]